MHPGSTRIPTAIALAVVVTLGLGACGDDGPATETGAAFPTGATGATGAAGAAAGPKVEAGSPGAAVTAYIAAFSTGNGSAVCKLYTSAQRRRIAKAVDGTCAKGIERAFLQGGAEEGFKQSLGNVRVADTEIDGERATVRLVAVQAGSTSDALSMQLEREGDRWLISEPGGAGTGGR